MPCWSLLYSLSCVIRSISLEVRLLSRSAWVQRLVSMVVCLIVSFDLIAQQPRDPSFKLGETLYFDLYVGFWHVGEGHLKLRKKLVHHKGKSYAHIRAYGKTRGLWRMLYKVDDVWGSYYDLEEGYPVYFYRFIKENNYRKYETTVFDKQQRTIEVQTYEDEQLRVPKEAHSYELSTHPYDIVSVYYKIRSLHFDTLREGAVLELPIFFEDLFYKVRIRYLGTHLLKTELGSYQAHLLSPILPENKVFRGEDAVKVWISTDRNKLPLRVYADMKLGSVRADLKAFQNLRYAFGK